MYVILTCEKLEGVCILATSSKVHRKITHFICMPSYLSINKNLLKNNILEFKRSNFMYITYFYKIIVQFTSYFKIFSKKMKIWVKNENFSKKMKSCCLNIKYGLLIKKKPVYKNKVTRRFLYIEKVTYLI